ncbi:hypothetical protein EKO23_22860 [Nocardioides guangzhouensis]|uniref:Tetratricopeptide repeat protein n=1 Tax=Nocardioides guangzhouensis TaxID=2497878 RepID=A0A4Q4Z4H7_9ACTN|nr:hypothetical protein [Nocardioides guangzhouensis]RYP81866.1 hypothetical protein EKO23_22860 [Nocardioides guangzhouensis]
MTTAHELQLSTDADTAALWWAYRDRDLRRLSGTADALRAVLDADPSLAVAHAAAVVEAMFADAPFDVEAELAAARRGNAAQDWERSFVECVLTTASQGMWPARPSWERHHDWFPEDLYGLELVIFLTLMSTDPDAQDAALARALRTQEAVGEHVVLLGFRAMMAQDRHRLDEAEGLASRALALDPSGFLGGHPMAHVYFEAGDHASGAAWLDGWFPGTDQHADFGSHLVWHSALHHLALGNHEIALDRYLHCARRAGPGGLVDGTSMLWRCQMHGLVGPGADPAETPVAQVVAPVVDRVPFTFVGVHVALGLATASDADGLRRFAANAAGFTAPGSAELLPGLARALASYVEGDHAVASDLLLAEEPHFLRYGGSHAQREVVEDTLIQALLRAGRLDEAATRLTARLDRRESPLDTALLARTARPTRPPGPRAGEGGAAGPLRPRPDAGSGRLPR